MFKSNSDSCVYTSIFISIYLIFGIRNYFTQILLFILLKLDKNINVPSFFFNIGYNHSGLFPFLIVPGWKILSTSFLKTASCSLGTRYCFVWYILASSCSYISTEVFQLLIVTSKSNSYLLNRLWSIDHSSSVIFFSFWLELT